MSLLPTIASVLSAVTLAFGAAPASGAATLPDDPTDRGEGNNPTLAQKVLGLDAWIRVAGRQPDVLMLGSSRSVMLDPRQVRRLTGRHSWNAGISSAAARELLAMTTFANLRSGGRPPHLLVMLDLEAFDNRTPTARVVDYQRRMDATIEACDVARRCLFLGARRLVADAIARQRYAPRDWRTTQRADGRQINGMLERMDREGQDLSALRERRIQLRIESYRAGGFDRVYATPRAAFERMLATANGLGVEPVVAITTMHPRCIELCGPRGWSARRAEVRAMLDELQGRYDFRYIDLSYPASWGGSGADFYDEIHLRPLGAAKVVRRLVRFGAFASS